MQKKIQLELLKEISGNGQPWTGIRIGHRYGNLKQEPATNILLANPLRKWTPYWSIIKLPTRIRTQPTNQKGQNCPFWSSNHKDTSIAKSKTSSNCGLQNHVSRKTKCPIHKKIPVLMSMLSIIGIVHLHQTIQSSLSSIAITTLNASLIMIVQMITWLPASQAKP